jgi:hypothetical protein
MNEIALFINDVLGGGVTFEVYHNRKLVYRKHYDHKRSLSDLVQSFEEWKEDQENFKKIMP